MPHVAGQEVEDVPTLLVDAVPFVYNLGARIVWFGNRIVIFRPGVELILFAGSPYGFLNGVPILVPSIPILHRGIPFIPPLFVSPIFGATVYRDPVSGVLFIRGPVGW